MLLIGDVHGCTGDYKDILEQHKPEYSFQLGDFGFKEEHTWFQKNIDGTCHKIVFGNHDYFPNIESDYSCKYFSTFELQGYKIATIAGAYSIDWMYRKEGISWWREEEMDYRTMQKCVDTIRKYKPDIILSHAAPRSILGDCFGIWDDASITGQGMKELFMMWQPRLWVFGHYHRSMDIQIDNTRFKCLAELETFTI